MIELRWVERKVTRDDGFYLPPLKEYVVEKVLQYRTLLVRIGRERSNYARAVTQENWSDWQDVPTVPDTPR